MSCDANTTFENLFDDPKFHLRDWQLLYFSSMLSNHYPIFAKIC